MLTADSSSMWDGVTVSVDEERKGTSMGVSGSFELGVSGNEGETATVSYAASAVEVSHTERERFGAYFGVLWRSCEKVCLSLL